MEQYNITVNNSTGSDDGVFYWEWSTFMWKRNLPEFLFVGVLAVIEIPVMILTLIALCFLVKSRPAASVFISHLILSDLIQVMCMLISAATSWTHEVNGAYYYSLIVSLYFMACVSFERYLLVSHPIWYKSHQSLKLSCFISVIVWFVPLTFVKIAPPRIYFHTLYWNIACLIPYPIVILCFVGTWRGLSRSISLTALKRKLILGSLFLVLLTYTFIIFSFVILSFIYIYIYSFNNNESFVFLKFLYYTRLLVFVNPLADCLLYLFMRPDVGDLMKSVHCCCRHQSSVVNPQNRPESHAPNTCSSVLTRC